MKTETVLVDKFYGLATHLDINSVALGGYHSLAGMARYFPDRLQRIPGIQDVINIANAANGIPLGWRTRIGGTEYLMSVISQNATTARLWNVTSAAEITGATALADNQTGIWANQWSTVYYIGFQWVTNGLQEVQKILTSTTRADAGITGSASPLKGHFLSTYLNRIYLSGLTTVAGVAATDNDKSRVMFSDAGTVLFQAASFVYLDEIPGEIIGTAINSPTSADGTVSGELVIVKESGIGKLSGDPLSSSSTKDIVSATVGSDAIKTFVNTPNGLIFMGKSNGKYSIYLLPVGSSGEPTEIGRALDLVLNDPNNPLVSPRLSRAIYHDRFYKLFVNKNGTLTEVWAEVTKDGDVIWYGPHERGVKDSPVVLSDNTLNLFGVISGQGKHFRERTDFTASYTKADQTSITAEIHMPLNVEPFNDDKSYDWLRVYLAKESNIPGRTLNIERLIDGVSQGGSISLDAFGTPSTSGFALSIPLVGSNGARLSSRSCSVKIKPSTGERLDILRADVKYLRHEKEGARG